MPLLLNFADYMYGSVLIFSWCINYAHFNNKWAKSETGTTNYSQNKALSRAINTQLFL